MCSCLGLAAFGLRTIGVRRAIAKPGSGRSARRSCADLLRIWPTLVEWTPLEKGHRSRPSSGWRVTRALPLGETPSNQPTCPRFEDAGGSDVVLVERLEAGIISVKVSVAAR